MSFRIQSVSAYIAIDDDDEEGIIGMRSPSGEWMPFVAADEERVKQLRPLAELIAQETGKVVKLVRFSVREDVEEIRP